MNRTIKMQLSAAAFVAGILVNVPGPVRAQVAASAGGKYPLHVKVDVPGQFTYRFVRGASDAGTAPASLPLPASSSSNIVLSMPHKAADLEVCDVTRGNVARMQVLAGANVVLAESAFKECRSVLASVQEGGVPVAGPRVTLSTSSPKVRESTVLTASDDGIARFRNVPLNVPVTVTVEYGSNSPVSLTETIGLDHPAAAKVLGPIEVTWSDVQTLSPGAHVVAKVANTSIPAPAESGGNNELLSFVRTLVALVSVGGIVYGAWWAVTTGHAKTWLSHLGIETAPVEAPASLPGFGKQAPVPVAPITEGTAEPLTAPGQAVVAGTPRIFGSAGAYGGHSFELNGSSLTIGRDITNQVALSADGNVSRRHAVLRSGPEGWTVTDLGSANGTFVNGIRIAPDQPSPIQTGDELHVGLTRFRFDAG
ncbi:MAG: FHA domain-containing protein [Armatimonadetes bacterium]|nr:FHA domain-containing protein [Armatimonadota bacterium]MDE2206631.1 FHA domain-containing protein [Armatimonadota bacterium]